MIVQSDVPFSLSILNDIALSCVIRVTILSIAARINCISITTQN